MSRILLDTSGYAAFLRGHPGAKAAVQEASELFLSPVVLGELRSGFLKGRRAGENEKRLQEFLASPRCSVPAIDDETASRYAVIHDYLRRRGTPVSPNDLWIAASAAQHGLTVLTLDGDFERIPQVFLQKLEAEEPEPERKRRIRRASAARPPRARMRRSSSRLSGGAMCTHGHHRGALTR